jgi:hypothetical protein
LGAESAAPVAQWSFEESSPTVARDSISGRDDTIVGLSKRVTGATGQALRFDGYTTGVERPAAETPKLDDAVTFEGWIALQAYPWGLCAIVNQADEQEVKLSANEGMIPAKNGDTAMEPDPRAGYFFGIDGDGLVHLQLSLGGHWVKCRSDATISLMKWTHIAGTYEAKAGQIVIYLNGERAGSAPAGGHIDLAREASLLIGKNHKARTHAHPIRLGPPALYGIEGCLDEIRIYDRALGADEIRHNFRSIQPPTDSGMRFAKLPEVGRAPGGFGAYYTRLKFTDAWDAPRRDGPDSDVVVLFDDRPWKCMFWRGTSYIPHWVTENGIWYTNEFNETWGNGALGCAEPMADKQTRFSRVSIVENSAARVVVHWRYALADTRNVLARIDPLSGWGDWSDEYHIIYPDGIGVRKICLWSTQPREPHEFQESIVLIPPGARPEDVIQTEAVTMVNLQGESHVYSWAEHAPDKIDQPASANIEVINVRSAARPFLIVPDEPFEVYGEKHAAPLFRPFNSEIKREHSLFPWYNHWPVAQIPSDGRWATHPDRVAHSSLTTGLEWKDWANTPNSRTRIMLNGLTERPAERLAEVARSWLRAPELQIIAGRVNSKGYDRSERAYLLECTDPQHTGITRLALAASSEHPLYNPAFIIKSWGNRPVKVSLDGRELKDGPDLRTAIRRQIDGDDLIVWLKLESTQPLQLALVLQPGNPTPP